MKEKLELIPNYGDHMTLEQFIGSCKSGCFIDYDGYGYYATKDRMTNIVIRPSHVTGKGSTFSMKTGKYRKVKIKVNIDKSYSHIVWFNR